MTVKKTELNKNKRITNEEEKNEVIMEVLDACTDYLIKDTKLTLQLLMHKVEFYEKRRDDIIRNKPYWFQFIKKSKFEKELEEIGDSIFECYAKIEEELAFINDYKDSDKKYKKTISFNDLLTMIKNRKNPKRVKLNLCNDSAIYEYSIQDHSYVLKDEDKANDVFNIYLNESLTDVEMLENIIEII